MWKRGSRDHSNIPVRQEAQSQDYWLKRVEYNEKDLTVKVVIETSPFHGWNGKSLRLPASEFTQIIYGSVGIDGLTKYSPRRLLDYLERTFPDEVDRLKAIRKEQVERLAEEVLEPDPEDSSVDIDTSENV